MTMLKTKIVCTLGPSSENKYVIKQLIIAGMNIARINLSHGNHEEHRKRINALRKACEELNANVAVLLDTKGPEIRLGTFYGGKVLLDKGQEFVLTPTPMIGNEREVFINYDHIAETVKPGEKILLADGLIELCVKDIQGDKVVCTVVNGGELSDRQGVNIPNVSLSLPALTQKDLEDILFAIDIGADFIAASF
jgi:pyruvate kinase